MLNQPKHTPGILSIYDDGDSPDCSDILLAHTDDTNWDVCEISTDLPVLVRKANARRLVACWNDCQGISTEALEGGVIADLRATLDAIYAELVACIINDAGHMEINDQGYMSTLIDQARAVLAQTKQED